MAVRSTNRVRIVSNYVRLLSSFALGLILVRLLLGIGEEAYALIALLGAGAGIASAIKDIGYEGWIIMETSNPSNDPVADAKRNAAYIRGLFGMTR